MTLSCDITTAYDTYICLRKRDPVRSMARYYALSVQPSLFGGHSVICEWGRGQVRIMLHESRPEANEALLAKIEEKKRRGYVQERGLLLD